MCSYHTCPNFGEHFSWCWLRLFQSSFRCYGILAGAQHGQSYFVAVCGFQLQKVLPRRIGNFASHSLALRQQGQLYLGNGFLFMFLRQGKQILAVTLGNVHVFNFPALGGPFLPNISELCVFPFFDYSQLGFSGFDNQPVAVGLDAEAVSFQSLMRILPVLRVSQRLHEFHFMPLGVGFK